MPAAFGFLCLAVLPDILSRRIVGWAMTNHLRSELVPDALEIAVTQRRQHEVMHMAAYTRKRVQGSQDEFTWWSRQLISGWLRWRVGGVRSVFFAVS